MERVDPGWSDFTQRVEADNDQREFLQNELATQEQEYGSEYAADVASVAARPDIWRLQVDPKLA
jgi:hypothetical protein